MVQPQECVSGSIRPYLYGLKAYEANEIWVWRQCLTAAPLGFQVLRSPSGTSVFHATIADSL